MKFGSLFSGVGGFDLGFERAGMRCAWQCEIDPKASAVLAKHWPGIPNIGDVKNVTAGYVEPVDLICGGFPCQDLSVAGKRKGLAGERSGLWFEFHRILSELKPRWVVIENVPGLLSSHGGGDFAVLLSGLAELGYLSAWRVLDAQYFGVAQRRRRVFIVASLGDGRCAEVLFEREGVRRDTPPSRETRQGFASVAGTLAASGGGMERPAGNCNELDFCIPIAGTLDGKCCAANRGSQANEAEFIVPIAGTVSAKWAKGTGGPAGDEVQNLVAYPIDTRNALRTSDPSEMNRQGVGLGEDGDPSPTLTDVFTPAVATVSFSAGNSPKSYGIAATLGAQDHGNPPLFGVRRLTPTECERLQGFPDGWTAMGADGKPQSDSARYKQMGNAVCVSVAEWIGRRIMEADHA